MDKPTPVWGVHPISQVLADQPMFVIGSVDEAARVAAAYLHSVPGGIRLVRYTAWETKDITCVHDLRTWVENQHERKDSPEDGTTPEPPPRSA